MFTTARIILFQSAPPVETRGDPFKRGLLGELLIVSIRSPRRNEGRQAGCCFAGRKHAVSIRSPRRNEGRQTTMFTTARIILFQSAPPVETRGDDYGDKHIKVWLSVSIRSPRRNEGRHVLGFFLRCLVVVSIRSPRRNEGRLDGHINLDLRLGFQSAPPVETRGDRSGPAAAAAVQRVSIRSPRRNEGRLYPLLEQPHVCIVSIRSPRRNEGRLDLENGSAKSLSVSIRSPRRNEGRHCCRRRYEGRG